MYIDSIDIQDLRAFARSKVDFIHPQREFGLIGLPEPRIPNINLVLGNNERGKTTLLKAVALAALGPSVPSPEIQAYRLIRREAHERGVKGPEWNSTRESDIQAAFTPHEQDGRYAFKVVESHVKVKRQNGREKIVWAHPDEKRWHPIYSPDSTALFLVGYGAARSVMRQPLPRLGDGTPNSEVRARRVRSLFEETYPLVPMNSWLPEQLTQDHGRFQEAVALVNRLLGDGHYRFAGEIEDGEYVFERNGLKIPFPALSDGYRAYLGWIGDLLYHVCTTCPPGKRLAENRGIVMVDEIDLYLHPKWQMTLLPTLARALPQIQFIVTSHSPLLVGSLEWMNVIVMRKGPRESSRAVRFRRPVHGLDADQVLLTEFFGLRTTRAESKEGLMKRLTLEARSGNREAAERLLKELSRGSESSRVEGPDSGEPDNQDREGEILA